MIVANPKALAASKATKSYSPLSAVTFPDFLLSTVKAVGADRGLGARPEVFKEAFPLLRGGGHVFVAELVEAEGDDVLAVGVNLAVRVEVSPDLLAGTASNRAFARCLRNKTIGTASATVVTAS